MLKVPHLETALTGPLRHLEKKFLENQVTIEGWFREQWQQTPPTFYGSVDLRNAGFKLAPVDTNLFPAGFNNLNPDMMALCVQAVQATMAEKSPCAKRLLLIPESHTRNLFYFENLAMLSEILKRAGFDVRIASLIPDLTAPLKQLLPSGREIILEPLIRDGDRVGVENYFPCCIVLNNDFSAGIPDVLKNTQQVFLPSLNLGWSTRLKSDHFRIYQTVTDEFSKVIDIDPWLINPYFDHCGAVDFSNQNGQECLAERASVLFQKIREKYAEYKIEQSPFVVVKADQGTYGMAVMMIQDPLELTNLNRKQRTKMMTLKGGSAVTKAIMQEGVHTFETVGEDRAVAEPVVYHIGRHVVGGFYRIHKNRGIDENLNAPGMDFHPLAFAKNCHVPPFAQCEFKEPVNRFYAYGVVGRLAMIAAARETL
ncbi:MAG: glutamate--cysteine ligase [Gammaproteobacteria bacterium RIFCSPHIGHO2_12_FULL_40_19]|nr:MAG: glutamate--cysteine ligase [Gammaproteobacteria bacterium RIFCSPHIGHO2_12_FULL_40_19]